MSDGIEGLEKVLGKLSELQKKAANATTRKALRAGAKVIQAAVVEREPEVTGLMKAATKVTAGRRRKGVISVLVSIGKKWFAGKAFYAAFVDMGHRQGKRKLGDKRKLIPGRHFMEAGFDASKGAAMEAIEEKYHELLDTK